MLLQLARAQIASANPINKPVNKHNPANASATYQSDKYIYILHMYMLHKLYIICYIIYIYIIYYYIISYYLLLYYIIL